MTSTSLLRHSILDCGAAAGRSRWRWSSMDMCSDTRLPPYRPQLSCFTRRRGPSSTTYNVMNRLLLDHLKPIYEQRSKYELQVPCPRHSCRRQLSSLLLETSPLRLRRRFLSPQRPVCHPPTAARFNCFCQQLPHESAFEPNKIGRMDATSECG